MGFRRGAYLPSATKPRKVLTVLEHAKAHPTEDIITLDAEKDFDNVSFHWLSLVLARFGFLGPLLGLMYTAAAKLTVRSCCFFSEAPELSSRKQLNLLVFL